MTSQAVLDIVEGSITHAARSGGGFSLARAMAFDQLLRNGIDADDSEVDAALNQALGVQGTPKALGDPVTEWGSKPVALEQAVPTAETIPTAGTPKPLGKMLPE